MFAKLLKHDFKANAGLLSLLGACVLGVGCISAVILRLLTTYWEKLNENEELALLLIPAILFLFAAYLAIIFYGVSTQYIQLFRFYKSRFTDEGYLTFTLPVKTSHIFLSSAVNILIWDAIVAVVIVAALAIAVVLGPVWSPEVLANVRWIFSDMKLAFAELTNPVGIVITVISTLILMAYSVVAPMTAVVLGASAAKKHKVLAIIGIMIGISIVTGTLNGIVSGVMQFVIIASEDTMEQVLMFMPLASCIFPLLFTILGYWLSIHLMKKRLNLP